MTSLSESSPKCQVSSVQDRWQKSFELLFRQCPGAWVGAAPSPAMPLDDGFCSPGYDGHIPVDPPKVALAVLFLRRKRVTITRTRLSPGSTCPGGIQLFFSLPTKGGAA